MTVVLHDGCGHRQGHRFGTGRKRFRRLGGDAGQFYDLRLAAASTAGTAGSAAGGRRSSGTRAGRRSARARCAARSTGAAASTTAEIRRGNGEFHLSTVHGGGVGDLLNRAAASGTFGFKGGVAALNLATGDGVGRSRAQDVAGDRAIGCLVERHHDFQSVIGSGEIAGPFSSQGLRVRQGSRNQGSDVHITPFHVCKPRVSRIRVSPGANGEPSKKLLTVSVN